MLKKNTCINYYIQTSLNIKMPTKDLQNMVLQKTSIFRFFFVSSFYNATETDYKMLKHKKKKKHNSNKSLKLKGICNFY